MNRKQRRVAESQTTPQASHQATISLLGKSYTVEEADVMAIKEYGLGNLQAALYIFHLITVNAPNRPDAHYKHGFILQAMSRYADALASYDKAIALKPDFTDAYTNRGVALQELKRYDEALASYDKTIALKPNDTIVYTNRGDTLRLLKRYDEALVNYHKTLAIKPDDAIAYNNRGVTLREMQRYDEALASIDKALALSPGYADAYNNRGVVLQELKRYDEALASFDKALAFLPDQPIICNNRGDSLQNLKRYDEALASFDRAIALNPGYAEAHSNRGVTLREAKRYDEALASFDKAIALNPDYAEAYSNRGVTQQEMKQYEDALASFDKAIALNPDIPYLLGSISSTKMHICSWQGLNPLLEKLAQKIDAEQPASSPLLAIPLSTMRQRKCTEFFVKNKFPPSATPLWKGEKYAHDRIRIGYFSSDFRNHALSYLMAEFFELHDRSKFEVTAFSFEPPSDDSMRTRLKKAFEHFIEVHDQSEQQIATLARSMEIDIAVNLNGFTNNSRTKIFTMRPAPVQVSYMGYPGTMGASYIDYLIADPVVIPEEHKGYYTEKIVHLPNSYWVIDSTRNISEKSPTRQEMGLPEDGFIFCCFNNSFKVTPEAFDIWMRLLHKVSGSVLWLLEGNPAVTKNLREEARSRGIADDRLVFAKRMDPSVHLARQRLAGLFLDTFHYNAHTTASDALWEGLPVLTCLGEGFAGRVAASLLHAANLPELVTHSHVEYEALALELATHPQKLSAIRHKLAQNRAHCPLFNTKLFTKHFEDAFIRMQERSLAGLPPDDMYVQA